jgi:hypothetical protein
MNRIENELPPPLADLRVCMLCVGQSSYQTTPHYYPLGQSVTTLPEYFAAVNLLARRKLTDRMTATEACQ